MMIVMREGRRGLGRRGADGVGTHTGHAIETGVVGGGEGGAGAVAGAGVAGGCGAL